MKTIMEMAKGPVTGMVLEDVPNDIPNLDSCTTCALTKSKHLPFKKGRTSAIEPLHIIHGDIVGPMPEESTAKKLYALLLVGDYSRVSWALFLRYKSDAPVEFQNWIKLVQKQSGRNIKTVMVDNARELVAGKMKEIYDVYGIRITLSVPYSPSSNGIAGQLVATLAFHLDFGQKQWQPSCNYETGHLH